MISSWRRTLRWLAPNPPGRSQMASWSWMIQWKWRGWMPCAHLPFAAMSSPPDRPGPVMPPVDPDHGGDDVAARDGRTDVVDTDHPRPEDHGPTCRWPANRPAGRRRQRDPGPRRPRCPRAGRDGPPAPASARARSTPRDRLRLVPTSTGKPSATSRRGGRAGPRCGPWSCRTRCPGRPRPRRPRPPTAAVGPVDQEPAGPRRPRRRSGGRPAWCGGRPPCAWPPSRRRSSAATGHSDADDVVDQGGARRHGGAGGGGVAGVDRQAHPGPARSPRPRPRAPAAPGRCSASGSTGAAPGRVDSPPTSMTAAPSATISATRARAAVGRRGAGRRRRTSRA